MTKNYRVTGKFKMGPSWAHFVNDVATESPAKAREKILSEFGSRHHVERRYIEIEKVEEVKAEDSGHGH